MFVLESSKQIEGPSTILAISTLFPSLAFLDCAHFASCHYHQTSHRTHHAIARRQPLFPSSSFPHEKATNESPFLFHLRRRIRMREKGRVLLLSIFIFLPFLLLPLNDHWRQYENMPLIFSLHGLSLIPLTFSLLSFMAYESNSMISLVIK